MNKLAGTFTKTKVLWFFGGLCLLAFYFIFDPLESSFMPQCVFHKITGLQCMGCGSQRVIHALLHGDFASAWEANRFLVLALPFLAFLIYVEMTRLKHPALYKSVHSLPVIIIVSATLLAWLILRNIYGV